MIFTEYDLARDKSAYLARFFEPVQEDESWKDNALAMSQDYSMREIAERLGVTVGRIEYLFNARGVKRNKVTKYTNGELRMLISLQKQGFKKGQIAERMAVTKVQVDAMRRLAKNRGML